MEAAQLTTPQAQATREQPRGRVAVALSSLGAVVLGAAPHVLHHAGPLAGAALFAGAAGSLLFGAIGLIAAIPFLLKLHRRCGNWRIPAATLALFAAIFAFSTFVIAPAITGSDSSSGSNAPSTPQQPSGHESHHQ